jgi:hypothetical protein
MQFQLLYSLFLVSFILLATLRLVSRVGGQRVTLRHVSNRPLRTRACTFPLTRRSRPGAPCALTAYPLAVRGLHRMVADLSIVLRPFPWSQALP